MHQDDTERRQALHAAITAVVNDVDPIGLIGWGAPQTEYHPEVDAILDALPAEGLPDRAQVEQIIAATFDQWFRPGAASAAACEAMADGIRNVLAGVPIVRQPQPSITAAEALDEFLDALHDEDWHEAALWVTEIALVRRARLEGLPMAVRESYAVSRVTASDAPPGCAIFRIGAPHGHAKTEWAATLVRQGDGWVISDLT